MKLLLGGLLSVAILLAACSEQKETVKKAEKPVIESAWLQGSLPDNTIAYIRVPTAWFLFTGQPNGFALAQNNAAHNQQIKHLQKAVSANFLSKMEPPLDALSKLLVEHMSSPLEIALVQQSAGQPMPITVIGTRFEFGSIDAFNEALRDSAEMLKVQGIQLAVNDDGTGSFAQPGMISQYKYNPQSQEFVMTLGFATSVTVLNNVMESLVANPKHSMFDLQNEIDSSGNGLFAWVNAKQIMPTLKMSLSPYQLEELKVYGLDQMNAAAIGYGVSNNKTRLKMMVDMPKVGIRDFIPAVRNDFDIKTVGTPRTMVMMSVPSPEELKRLSESLDAVNGKVESSYENIDTAAQESLGFSLEEIVSVVGPEIIYFTDDVGSFTAVKVNKPAVMQRMIDSLKANLSGEYTVTKYAGKEIYHLSFKTVENEEFEELLVDQPWSPLGTISNIRTRLFWTIDNGYLIYSSVPQALMERIDRRPDSSLAKWVMESQGIDSSNSLFMATTSVRDLSRKSYHYYLELLLLASDVSNAELDIMSLPTANTMNFSDYGSIGVTLDSGEKYLGLEFTFEQSMSDLLLAAGGTQAVMVTGILAAVAIPAYQDYTKRSKLVQATVTANSLKSQVAYAQAMGEAFEELDLGKHGIGADLSSAEAVEYVDVEDGVVSVYLDPVTFGNGISEVYAKFEPIVEDDIIVGWNCDSNVDFKFREKLCGF